MSRWPTQNGFHVFVKVYRELNTGLLEEQQVLFLLLELDYYSINSSAGPCDRGNATSDRQIVTLHPRTGCKRDAETLTTVQS